MIPTAACPALTRTIPECRRLQAQREIVELITQLHRSAESLGKKLVGLQSADLKAQRRYVGGFHKFYNAGFHGSPELMDIEARLRGVTFTQLSDEYTRRAAVRADHDRKWEEARINNRRRWEFEKACQHGFTHEQAEAILASVPEPRAKFSVIDGGLS